MIPALACIGIVGCLGAGVVVWSLVSKGSLLPPTIASVFDSAGSVWNDADANDLKTAQWVDEYLANPAAMKDNERINELRNESRHLVARAVTLSPLSQSEATGLMGEGGAALSGPVPEAERDAIHEKMYERGNRERSFLLSVVGTNFIQNDFAREFLCQGHVELQDSSDEAEQVLIEQIRLLRRFNRLAGEIAVAEYGKKFEMQSQDDFKVRMDKLYAPIFDETTEITEELHELASRRYLAAQKRNGPPKKYADILYYVNQARAQILPNNLAMVQSGASLVDYLRDMRTASSEIDQARRGIKPDRLAKADAEKEQAAQQAEAERRQREQQEKERQDKLAADKAAEQNSTTSNDSMESSEPDSNALAGNDPSASGSPSGPGSAFGGLGRPPMGSGRPPFRGRPDFDEQSGGGPPNGFPGRPSGPRYGSGFGPGNRPPRPDIDTSTGITIKMSNAGSINSGPHTQKLSQTLKCSVNWSQSNGEVTIKIGYTGPMKDVIDLIEFGTVKSTDEAKRTIVVTPNP